MAGGGEDEGSRDQSEQMRLMFGPQGVDHLIRQAISTCWMMLAKDKKKVDVVEAEIRRMMERAIKDFKEDAQAFGMGGSQGG